MTEHRITRLGQALCVVGAALGALGLLAWLLGMNRVLTAFPGLPPMMPTSAAALLLLGIAGALMPTRRGPRLLATACAIAVLAVSVATAAEYALDNHLLLDQFVRYRTGLHYPDPSSPVTAVALALLASGLLFFDADSGKRFRPSEWFTLAAALIAVTALIAYLYGASPMYRLTGTPPAAVAASMRLVRVSGDLIIVGISFSTAVTVLVISTGMILERPDWTTMQVIVGTRPGSLLMRRLAPAAILLPIGFGIVASRLHGTGEAPVVLAGLTEGTTIVSLFLLGIAARHINREHDVVAVKQTRTREMVDLASDAMLIGDLEGRIIEVNDAACKLLDYPREELLCKTFWDLVPPEDSERLSRHRTLLLKVAGNVDTSEWTAVRKDGSRFPAEVSAKILPGGRWQGIARDISARKRLEEKLRRSEYEQRLLAELGAAHAETVSLEERLTRIAQLFSRELADFCMVDLVADDGSVRRAKVACADPGKEWLCDALMERPVDGEAACMPVKRSGDKLYVISKLTPDVIDCLARSPKARAALQREGFQSAIISPMSARGKLLGVLSLLSVSRAFGEQDLRLVEILSHRAALMLDLAGLLAAAQRATQTRDDMLGVVAHDLRNPLTVIIGLGTALERGPERAIGEEIRLASARMDRMIQDLLDVTRLEAGAIAFKQAMLSPSEILSDVIASQAPLAAAASLTIHPDMARDLPEVWADRDRLLQVFENLVGNAIKFTKPGGHVTVAARKGQNEVLFSVADTGCGIEGRHLPHAFDRFWQAPGVKRGAGLGLSIVRGIVEAHSGRVWVQSTLGKGSTFFFTIPTAVKTAPPQVPDRKMWEGTK